LLQGRSPRLHVLQIHARVLRLHAHQDNLIATRLIGHYPSIAALRVLDQLQHPNLFPFNAIIRVLAQEGRSLDSFLVFRRLKSVHSLSPNGLTFSFILKACFVSKSSLSVKQIQTHVVKSRFSADPFVGNALIVAYGKGVDDVGSARKVFDDMPGKGVVCCWNSLISSYVQVGSPDEVMGLFCSMVEENVKPESDTLVSVLSACSELEIDQIEKWVSLLSELVGRTGGGGDDDSMNCVLVYLYGKCGRTDKSRERFDCIVSDRETSVLPWNSMINAYVQNGQPLQALNLFRLMVDGDHGCKPNHVTMVSVLTACSQIGDLELGQWVHDFLKTRGCRGVVESNKILATALIDMYCKCGSLDKAKEVFSKLTTKDAISFNAMIMGLAVNGKGEDAIHLFEKMQDFSLYPNAGTFLGLLWACSHSGLSNKGRQIFNDMTSVFGIPLRMEHYACYIDILARDGQLEEAASVAASMPFKPNNFVWGALLGGCLLHSRLDLAQDVYNRLVEVDPDSSACYVMLANVLAGDRRWDDVSVLRWFMREKGVKKQPGSSWVNVNGIVHEFVVGSAAHPQMANIYHTLHGLAGEMRFLTP
ncbi:unnamed protein product, partial [Linum tenue]